MAPKRSAGILVFRRSGSRLADLEVLLGHMGGPMWARRDGAAWSIPKGEYDDAEDPQHAARREFTEELGLDVPAGPLIPLGTVKQSGGKTVTAWAVEADLDPADVTPGYFTMEWPPRSGQMVEFPELDRVTWMTLDTAAHRIVKGQRAFLDRLSHILYPPDTGSNVQPG